MPTVPSTPTTSKAGIATNTTTGERHIPSSVRPDGSLRKEIRVRPGYRPPEDVEVYKNRTAEAWKNRGSGGVPGAETLDLKSDASAAANKNAKRREARKKAAAAVPVEGQAQNGVVKADKPASSKGAEKMEEHVDPESEKVKEAKKLSKKLRQARELKEKKDKGNDLLPEQFEKVIRINELIRQLDSLGFDEEGEKKANKEGTP
ncbi:hypothetical protein W97_04753 [Coniosporium apollinis CBS 100218]|uniref:WIBG Mago-binding domain-containing protein n=1 Tax=Coniosporium apollinis (strain CBS 100218) TaxID=1168221 RepID=R7YUE4_CONA1|nr:uncharacterized protein W97_04753 [Coniosporium apollinis CBS 100218]EON65515.1 hypothetical protein W97_04753 [Coniosporium apollinis CBS 100218]